MKNNAKRYIADTMVEAMERVRTDLGEDAVIVRSSVIKPKGLFKWFKKNQVEVVAIKQNEHSSTTLIQPPVVEDERPFTMEVTKELEEVKQLLQQMKHQTLTTHYPPLLEKMYQHLLEQEINETFVNECCTKIFEQIKAAPEIDWTEEKIVSETKEYFFSKLSVLSYGGVTHKKRFINIIGPTGVGKTTTIAKVAARTLLEKKKKIAFITTDTYRIGAIEQLKTYANLLQSPVEVVYTRNDYKEALKALEEYDFIFIDTAGRNYRENEYVEELKEVLPFDETMETYLVLSATSKERDMDAVIRQFHSIPIEQFIFTKIDETSTIGPIINMMVKYNKGIAYCTDGQEVPEDIIQVTAQSLTEAIVKGAYDEK